MPKLPSTQLPMQIQPSTSAVLGVGEVWNMPNRRQCLLRIPQQHVTRTHGTRLPGGTPLSRGGEGDSRAGGGGWQRLLLEQWGRGDAALHWRKPNTQEGSARAPYPGQGIWVSPSTG